MQALTCVREERHVLRVVGKVSIKKGLWAKTDEEHAS